MEHGLRVVRIQGRWNSSLLRDYQYDLPHICAAFSTFALTFNDIRCCTDHRKILLLTYPKATTEVAPLMKVVSLLA